MVTDGSLIQQPTVVTAFFRYRQWLVDIFLRRCVIVAIGEFRQLLRDQFFQSKDGFGGKPVRIRCGLRIEP